LTKSLVLVESLALELDPEINLMQEIEAIVGRVEPPACLWQMCHSRGGGEPGIEIAPSRGSFDSGTIASVATEARSAR
jgi:hypothetical protein